MLTVTSTRHGLQVSDTSGRVSANTFTKQKHYKEAAKMLQVDVAAIEAAVAEFRARPPAEPVADETSAPEHSFRVRAMASSESSEFPTFAQALAASVEIPDSVIEWKDSSLCAAVDFDWHGDTKPPEHMLTFAITVTPCPTYAWLTKSGGLRLIYDAPGADMLGAVAAVKLADRFNPTGLELLTRTRRPAEMPSRMLTGELATATQSSDTVDDDARDAWLDEHGFTIGQRYGHEHCVIEPGRKSNSPSPVVVTEYGIYCHSCTTHTGRGFRSWAALTGAGTDDNMARLVRGFVHWEHAKLTLTQQFKLSESVLAPYYRACLTGRYGAEDPRIGMVFNNHGVIRGSGVWITHEGYNRTAKNMRATVSGLPAVCTREGKPVPQLVEKFLEAIPLDSDGYKPVRLIHGARIGTHHGSLDPRPSLVLSSDSNRPQYVPPGSRMTEPDAWAKVEELYPRIDRQLIELLVVARGAVERGAVSMAPMIFLDGVSGSGKTAHTQIAAAICGDMCTDLIPTSNDDTMGMRLWEAFQKGSFISVNEAAKGALKARVDETSFLNFLLHISPTATYRVLYHGHAALGGCPIVSITDIQFDEAVMSDGQLGRRAWYRNLGTEPRNWKLSTAAYGLGNIFDVRGQVAELTGLKHAVDSLLSHWIDRHFSAIDAMAPLDEVAASLGIKYMAESEQANDRVELMRQLFSAWQQWPGLKQSRTRKGWKAFGTEPESSDIARIWSGLHDHGNPVSWTRANERSWQQAVGWPNPLRLGVKHVRSNSQSQVQLGFEELADGKWRVLS